MDCQRAFPIAGGWEHLFATPCCNTSRATWSTPSVPPHMKPFLGSLVVCGFGPGCCCRLVCFEFGVLHFRLLVPVYPKRAGWRTRTLVVVFGFGPGWLLLSTCLKKMNLFCFISVCLYPKRAGWRTRTLVVVFGFGPGWLLLSTCLF